MTAPALDTVDLLGLSEAMTIAAALEAATRWASSRCSSPAR
jgi:hypothetical protein